VTAARERLDTLQKGPANADLLTARAAQARKRDIDYDVVGVAQAAPITPGQSAAGQTAVASVVAQEEAGSHAAEVMRAIMAQGVPAARIHLAVRSDPAITAGEIRVYVR